MLASDAVRCRRWWTTHRTTRRSQCPCQRRRRRKQRRGLSGPNQRRDVPTSVGCRSHHQRAVGVAPRRSGLELVRMDNVALYLMRGACFCLVAGGWWLEAGGWWLVAGRGCFCCGCFGCCANENCAIVAMIVVVLVLVFSIHAQLREPGAVVRVRRIAKVKLDKWLQRPISCAPKGASSE